MMAIGRAMMKDEQAKSRGVPDQSNLWITIAVRNNCRCPIAAQVCSAPTLDTLRLRPDLQSGRNSSRDDRQEWVDLRWSAVGHRRGNSGHSPQSWPEAQRTLLSAQPRRHLLLHL